jgi:hypothetical protein
MELSWPDFKAMVDGRNLSIQWVVAGANYWLKALDGFFEVECMIPVDESNQNTSDFVANYKANGNKSPTAQVITQFEKRDKTLKLSSAQQDVGGDSLATLLIKIPGTPGSTDGRWINGGIAWFDDQHKDDRVVSVSFTDEDNILGYGAGFVVGSYTDYNLDEPQQGWRIPNKRGVIEVEAIGGYGFAPSGFYLKIVGKKGGSLTTGTFYINIEWAKVE